MNQSSVVKGVNFCQFKNVKIIPGVNKNIISASYFVLKNGYKPHIYYADGLKFLSNDIKNAQTVNKILLRVYYDRTIELFGDQSAKDVIEYLKTQNHVELVYVDCDKLIDTQHAGVLGAIFRYLPFFDYDGNDVKYVWVQDIDYRENESADTHNTKCIQEFDKLITEKIELTFTSLLCYTPVWHTYLGIPFDGILGDFFAGGIKLPLSLLVNFLNSFLNNADELVVKYKKNYIAFVNEIHGKNLTKHDNIIKTCEPGNCIFSYGFDEFFLLLYFLPWCLKHGTNIQTKLKHPFGAIRRILMTTFRRGKLADKMINNFGILISNQTIARGGFVKFIEIFRHHDYESVNSNAILWDKFYKFTLANMRKYKPIINETGMNCFVTNSVYLTASNRMHKYTDIERKEMYNVIGKINNLFAD